MNENELQGLIATGQKFRDQPDEYAELITELADVLEAERDRADLAEAQVAYALSVLGTASIPLGVTELFFKDSLIREARRAISSPEGTA